MYLSQHFHCVERWRGGIVIAELARTEKRKKTKNEKEAGKFPASIKKKETHWPGKP